MKSNGDLRKEIANAVKLVTDQQSFLRGLLAETLEWPTADARRIGDISYNWSEEDLRARDLKKHLIDGAIWQIQPAAGNQPWGIFVLEFKNGDSLSPRRGMAGVLRQVLRGLVASRRRDPKLTSWKREHLLFICTHQYKTFRFAYFRSKTENPSSARLATFGWRPESDNRTLLEFNLPALVWPDDPEDAERWVSNWAKAFDKEPLTRDFFKRFDKALEAIKADLETHQKMSSADAYTASQLLLERLIFLYFLQNRGWLNRNGSYLKDELAKHSEAAEFSYYRDFLDKLFWTLSTAPSGAGRLPGVPFLNGGLFDDDEFRQPADTRKVAPPLKVRNGTMRYVFEELLEAFNFTVTEDTPLNQEVAVDPEMLGKVFESIVLHAEAADEDANAPDKRKGTGSYYTPRIVVHFICREALYQYLRNHLEGDGWEPRLKIVLGTDAMDGLDEEELKQLRAAITPEQARQVLEVVMPLKCCDPAVGSGAFPVGLMQELVNLRRVLETVANGKDPVLTQGQKWLHGAKAHVVENCLFGVDIQQQAIEICRLRLWLSLVVDYDLGVDPFDCDPKQFAQAIDGISQLPNLEMNFRRGDSLHDHICGVPVVILPDRSMKYFDDFKAIGKLGTELHKAKKSEKKRRLRVEILKNRLELSRKMVDEERTRLLRDDSALDGLFGIEESKAKKRDRNQREIANLDEALAKIQKDLRELEKLEQRQFENDFYSKLRKLEGADFDSPFNFAWHIDFPNVFAIENGGFDLLVGNPPFVTARNPKKRELWRQRWPRVCTGTYQLVCPFFDLGFSLLASRGQLGFIVSNAFATREFGQPLVEELFPELNIQKLIDCSGLAFPGHGTPTWLVFGSKALPQEDALVRSAVILPGGGDLRTTPDESPLWRALQRHHDEPGFSDTRIAVYDWPRAELLKWPVNLDYEAYLLRRFLEEQNDGKLGNHIVGTIGRVCFTGADDIFFIPDDLCRRLGIETDAIAKFVVGDLLRNWAYSVVHCICPYDQNGTRLPESRVGQLLRYLSAWREYLRTRLSYEQTQEERGLAWWEFSIVFPDRIRGKLAISITEIATHNHACVISKPFIANRANPIVDLHTDDPEYFDLLNAILCSSTALFWLKQVCYNKGAGKEEERDRFEFAGGKLQQLPLPGAIANALSGKPDALAKRMSELGRACRLYGEQSASLAIKKMFEKDDEAYHAWQRSMPGYISAGKVSLRAFSNEQELREALERNYRAREELRAHMVALQEEIDWLAYVAYGLLATDQVSLYAAEQPKGNTNPSPVAHDRRLFLLLQAAKGDFDIAQRSLPSDECLRRSWQARLNVIRGNPNVRRIEQPVYKRRWDEQWKVGNQWRCGEIAYAAEFIDGFEWWLKEKAEHWLEHTKKGGPTGRGDWTLALWQDERVQAAWAVAAEKYAYLENEKAKEKAEADGDPAPAPKRPDASPKAFQKLFKQLVEEESVPAGYEFGTPYEEIEKKLKKAVPKKLKDVRGKLNVPRERFHEVEKDVYLWAGLQFREKPGKSARASH